jgi:hypothetical protein
MRCQTRVDWRPRKHIEVIYGKKFSADSSLCLRNNPAAIAVAIGRLKEDLRGSSRSQAEAKKVSVSGHAASFAPQEADGLL